jgi:MFS family permease
VAAAVSFILLDLLPVDFAYWQFALVMLLNGIGMGLFTSPNRAGVMNSLPPRPAWRRSRDGATFQNSGTVLSIGIFFTLIIAGLAGSLPARLLHGLTAHGVRGTAAARVASLPPGLGAARLQPGAYSARPGARPPAARPGRLPDQLRLLPPP